MGQVLHGSATTTHAVRAAIQRSQASVTELTERHRLNEKTVRKWRKRTSVEDARMGPNEVRSSVLSAQEEAMCVAFRRHTLLPLDDCLYAPQASIPHLSRSVLHRLFQRHDISRLPDMEGDKPRRSKFKRYPIRHLHINIAELRTEEGKLRMSVGIDRTSKVAFAKLVETAGKMEAPRSCARSPVRCPTASTPSSPTTAFSSPIASKTIIPSATPSGSPAPSTASGTA